MLSFADFRSPLLIFQLPNFVNICFPLLTLPSLKLLAENLTDQIKLKPSAKLYKQLAKDSGP